LVDSFEDYTNDKRYGYYKNQIIEAFKKADKEIPISYKKNPML